jgi:EAL domain-containing protein (putative c-di-GMP-specific phosphodiesterase class I)
MATPEIDLSCLKVLVLEDQSFQRNLLVGVLKSLGVSQIESVKDGTSGLNVLTQTSDGFDVAICDLRMDGMDGIEFIRHAVRHNVRSFIVTSAIDGGLLLSAETVVRGYGTSLVGVLPKPVNIERLKGMLADCKLRQTTQQAVKTFPLEAQFTLSEVTEGLRNGQFLPYFQPQIDLETGLPNGVEMLARWNHPEHGVLPPSAFIPLMEQNNVIDWLSDSLFRRSMDCMLEWAKVGADIGLSINLSPLTLQNTDMPNHIQSLIRHYRVQPNMVTIEVTETAVSKNVNGLLESLTRLRMQGFSISVDDFGTGYSSLLQLSEMPFTEIKIDRNFVTGATENKKSTVIAHSIVQLAKNLDMRTVAEGVETEDEHRYVKQLGCQTGQGYLFARPLPQSALLTYLTEVRKRRGS